MVCVNYRAIIVLAVCSVAAVCLSGCGRMQPPIPAKRPPAVEITYNNPADTGFINTTPAVSAYLLAKYDRNFKTADVIWPPDELCRVIDISLDVTGSCFDKKVLLREGGPETPLAAYFVDQLSRFLVNEIPLEAGDRIYLRLYGARKYNAPGETSNLDPRSFTTLQVRKARLKISGERLSRRHNDLALTVEEVHAGADGGLAPSAAVKRIGDWFSPQVRACEPVGERYDESPLLKHIKDTVQQHPAGETQGNRIFIFLTDGKFQYGGLWFDADPKHHGTREAIATRVTEDGYKPFAAREANTRVVVMGLNSDGNPAFDREQADFLRWYFSPQPVELIPY